MRIEKSKFKTPDGNGGFNVNYFETSADMVKIDENTTLEEKISELQEGVQNALSAESAEKDSGGNVISETYLTKTAAGENYLAKTDAANIYAPIASPTFTGTPAAVTTDIDDDSTKIATTAHVAAIIRRLMGAAPATLDTLAELAAALASDPNFATTMTNALAGKLDSSTAESTYLSKTDAASTYLGKTATAAKATQLESSKTIRTNLASTSAASFNGTENITPGVTGTLPVGNGGTGQTSLANVTVGKATQLETARTLNIQDSTATNTGTGASFNGTGNATIKLPAACKFTTLTATNALIIPSTSSTVNGAIWVA